MPYLKPVVWVGRSYDDLKELPDEVQRTFGHALYYAQRGEKHPHAKPLRGFGGAGVLEIVEEFEGDAYRAVYTVKLAGTIYVLHVFQKKATHGIGTPRHEMELVAARLKEAEAIHRTRAR